MDDSTLYYTTTTTTADPGLLVFLGTMLWVSFLVAVVMYVLFALGLMKFFEKANKPGWAAWVPVYNYYVMTEVAGVPMYWFWILVAGILISWVPLLGLVTLVASIFILYKFLERYGKGAGHTVLALFFPFLYFIIVGNSKDLAYSSAAKPTAPTPPATPPAAPQA